MTLYFTGKWNIYFLFLTIITIFTNVECINASISLYLTVSHHYIKVANIGQSGSAKAANQMKL